MLRRNVVVVCLLSCALAVCAQTPASQQASSPSQDTTPWALLFDPVCPVAGQPGVSVPNATKELRVMYFPAAEKAKIKNPTEVTLIVGLGWPHPSASGKKIPMIKKDDHWEAVLPLEDSYAIFAVRDEKTGMIDDAEGEYWDLVFCVPSGERSIGGIRAQIAGLKGAGWPGIHRSKDLKKALSILEHAQKSGEGGAAFFRTEIWKLKAQIEGGDAAAWAKVSKEVEQFAAEYSDKPALYAVLNFVIMETQHLPQDFLDRVTDLLAKKMSPEDNVRQRIEYSRLMVAREPDAKKRLAALEAFIGKYPESDEAVFCMEARFTMLAGMGDVAGAEEAFARYHQALKRIEGKFDGPAQDYTYSMLASLYIRKGVKLGEALKLLDRAEELQKAQADSKLVQTPAESLRIEHAQLLLMKAEAYLKLNRYQEALKESLTVVGIKKGPRGCSMLARSYAGLGENMKALDAYFDSALFPSNDDLKILSELQAFYLKYHFGNQQQFVAEFKRRRAERFANSKYVPALIEKPAPELEFTTLAGEKLEAKMLREKTVVANFWSPG